MPRRFTTFRSSECQAKSPVKTLDKLAVRRAADEIEIAASARSFLHNQVRSMAGTLKLVGEGKWHPREVGLALAARDRSRCGPVAPPDGLYLMLVDGKVKPIQAANPPSRPPRMMPIPMPTWLLAGPGRNWHSATRSA